MKITREPKPKFNNYEKFLWNQIILDVEELFIGDPRVKSKIQFLMKKRNELGIQKHRIVLTTLDLIVYLKKMMLSEKDEELQEIVNDLYLSTLDIFSELLKFEERKNVLTSLEKDIKKT
jgi:uncharacterized protein YihD (DUF1040 family)